MNRLWFVVSLTILFVSGSLLLEEGYRNVFIIYFVLSSVVCFLRRSYLGMKPWWGGRLRDIPKYFTEP